MRWNGNIIYENSLHLILIKEADANVSENVNDDLNVMWLECSIVEREKKLHYNIYTHGCKFVETNQFFDHCKSRRSITQKKREEKEETKHKKKKWEDQIIIY